MNAMPTEDMSSSVVSFRDARWKTKWLLVGLAGLLLWRSIGFSDQDWLRRFPSWLLFLVTVVAPLAFLLIYPLLTRDPNRRATFGIPTPNRCLVEFGIAIPIAIGTIVVLAVINDLAGRLSPGSSLAPDAVTNMAKSSNRAFAYLLLLSSFTFAPIAEELFFRGFLYNAFRARMPTIVAALAQSLVFGFSHFFGTIHAGFLFAIGLVLTAVYEWRKTLITPILIHAGHNFVWAVGMILMMVAHANSPILGVFGDPNDTECIVRKVVSNSAAEEAGLRIGDIITSFNTEPIRDYPHLGETVRLYQPGDAIPVVIRRSGEEFEVTVVLRRRGDSL